MHANGENAQGQCLGRCERQARGLFRLTRGSSDAGHLEKLTEIKDTPADLFDAIRDQFEDDVVRSIPLFSRVEAGHFEKLRAAASVRAVPARTLLFEEGDRPDNLYSLMSGAAELFSEREHRRLTIAVVRPVSSLAVFCAFADRVPFSARTLEPSELTIVPAKLVAHLASRDLGLADAMVREIARESLAAVEDWKTHRLMTTVERIADWLLRQDGQNGRTGKIVIPFDKRVLASHLGMAQAQLSRHFADLAASGVSVHGNRVTIADREALAQLAGLASGIVVP